MFHFFCCAARPLETLPTSHSCCSSSPLFLKLLFERWVGEKYVFILLFLSSSRFKWDCEKILVFLPSWCSLGAGISVKVEGERRKCGSRNYIKEELNMCSVCLRWIFHFHSLSRLVSSAAAVQSLIYHNENVSRCVFCTQKRWEECSSSTKFNLKVSQHTNSTERRINE